MSREKNENKIILFHLTSHLFVFHLQNNALLKLFMAVVDDAVVNVKSEMKFLNFNLLCVCAISAFQNGASMDRFCRCAHVNCSQMVSVHPLRLASSVVDDPLRWDSICIFPFSLKYFSVFSRYCFFFWEKCKWQFASFGSEIENSLSYRISRKTKEPKSRNGKSNWLFLFPFIAIYFLS